MITRQSSRFKTDDLPLKIKLMSHQKAMVYQMLQLEGRLFGRTDAYAMMADLPGAGKSYAVLAMLYVTNQIIFKKKKPHVNLIVVPYNICSQWNTYMNKIYGPPGLVMNYKVLVEYKDFITVYVSPESLLDYDIILTTSLYFDTIAKTVQSLNLEIQRVFFDEADTIKNLLMTPLKCKMTWFISASMSTLFGKSDSLKIGEYSLSLSRLKANDVSCDPDWINDNIVLDPPATRTLTCPNIFHKLLTETVSSQHHTRLQSMDYSCIKLELVRENIILDSEYTACRGHMLESTARIDYCEHKIADLEEDDKAIMKQYNVVKDFDANEAKKLQDRSNEIRKLIHKHKETIAECRSILAKFDGFRETYGIDFNNRTHEEGNGTKSKVTFLKEFLSTIKTDPKRQCILFTDYDYVYRWLRSYMADKRITFRDLDGGNIASMDRTIISYKNGEYQVLLADSSMYSCGMNLENTSDICFIHRMGTAKENQVIGRAHRYGRNGVLNVTYILYE